MRSCLLIISAAFAACSVQALEVPVGTTNHSEGYLVISPYSNDNQLLVQGTLEATGLVVGDNCYDSVAIVAGGAVSVNKVYVGSSSRGCELLVHNGGVLTASAFSLYGDATQGVAYPTLRNSVTVTGAGSLLNITDQLTVWSPDAPGEPGQFEEPREIPAYLRVSSGGEVRAGSLSVTNGSWVSVESGGTLTVESDLNASEDNLYLHSGSSLTVGGTLSGLDVVGDGCMVEAGHVIGNLLVNGYFSMGSEDGVVDGDLMLTDEGTLDIRAASTLTVTGDMTLDGQLNVIFEEFEIPEYGDFVQLFEIQGSVSGAFDSVTPLAVDGLEWDTSELYTTGTLQVIPEPSTLALMGLSAGLVVMYRRATAHRS
ncbi:PEP-CTERM sorting domain-containing protein [Pontiella sp. NLcol2]|uniref:PEP-CTERM sorting domain-containing protein n=1 Tax=Pontiella agarivorans TaxID=3038953 RepID=A0ABU5MUW0_9BACT|nr:PEP-CTERM sorting domain-containing protein [Pontiella agarivorans]